MNRCDLAPVATTALVAAPVAASIDPAASLSVSKSVHAPAQTEIKSKLRGTGLILAIAAAGIVAGGVIIAANDNSDSN